MTMLIKKYRVEQLIKQLENIYIGNNNFINNKRQKNDEYDENDDNALFQQLEKQKLKQN